jgi:GAF domain-containing protein
MLEQIKRWLAPPVFEDANKTRAAGLLNTILLLLITATLVFMPTLITVTGEVNFFSTVLMSVVFAISLGLLILSRRGYVEAASIIITTTMFLLTTANVYQTGDVGKTGTGGLLIVVTIAAVLLGGRAAVVFMGLSVTALVLLAYLQIQNLLPPAFPQDIYIDGPLYVVIISLIGLLLRSTMNSLHNALLQVSQSNDQLKILSASLEDRVAARTRDIALAAEIGRRIAQERDVTKLLRDAVDLIQNNFGLYHTQVYLANSSRNMLVLRAASGQAGEVLLQRNHRLLIGSSSINGTAAQEKRPIIVSDTTSSPIFLPNTLLPETRSEMSIPIVVGQRLLGVLNLQGRRANELTNESLPAFETLAGQIAIALDNANLFAEIRQSQALLQEQTRRLSRENWQEYLNAIDRPERLGYTFSTQGTLPEISDASQTVQNSLFVSQIKVLDEPIGTIQIENAPNQAWDSENARIVNAVAAQVAQQVENLRLLDQAEKYRIEAEAASRRLTREGWQAYQETADISGFFYDNKEVHTLDETVEKRTADFQQPLQIRGETIGMINLANVNHEDNASTNLITSIAETLSNHIESLRLTQTSQQALAATEKQAHQLSLLNQMSADLNRADHLKEIINITLTKTPEIVEANSAGLMLLSPDGDSFEAYSLRDDVVVQVQTPDGKQMSIAGTLAETVIQERRLIIVPDARDSDKRDLQDMAKFNIRSVIEAPLLLGDRVLGILTVMNRNLTGSFTEGDANLMRQLASVVATTLENYRLFEQATKRANRESLINTINQKIQSTTSIESALEIATREIGQQLKARRAAAEIGTTAANGH